MLIYKNIWQVYLGKRKTFTNQSKAINTINTTQKIHLKYKATNFVMLENSWFCFNKLKWTGGLYKNDIKTWYTHFYQKLTLLELYPWLKYVLIWRISDIHQWAKSVLYGTFEDTGQIKWSGSDFYIRSSGKECMVLYKSSKKVQCCILK